MKIPKLFKKAAAFVMAAVTALSIMPATAFAAGDIGTISFSHTYDSKKAETIAQLETAKEEIKKPFAFEDELKEKTERLNALNIELNLNEKDTSVMDTEPEQTEEQPERKCASRER